MPRALFFPSYFGLGFGHISRSLPVAGELAAQGWHVAFVLSGPHRDAVRQAGFPIYEPRYPSRVRLQPLEGPAYTYIPDSSFQALRDGFTHPAKLRAAVAEAMLFLGRFKPDVLVGDLSLLTWIVGRKAGLPVVQIIRSMMHPYAPELIWWEQPPEGMQAPDIHPVFDPLLEKWGLPGICQAEDLFQGDLYLIPGIPELDPLPADTPDTVYTGPLLRRVDGSSQSLFPETSQPKVYITLGGGAGPVGSRHFFETLNQAFSTQRWTGLVSTGRRFQLSSLPPAPQNLSYRQWVPGLEAIRQADLVVFHGGYGTTMETVHFGKPSLVLPFHTEQEANGRRLEQHSAACVLSPAGEKSTLMLVQRRWRFGLYAYWIQPENPLQPEQLRSSIETILISPKYKQGAESLQNSIRNTLGPVEAAHRIKNLV